MKEVLTIAALAVALAYALPASAGTPPPGSKPLSSILATVAAGNPGTIVDAEFDDGRWEIKACSQQACESLHVDPATGAVTGRKEKKAHRLPPAGAMRLADIVQSVEAREHGTVTEAEFEHGYWKVEVREGTRKTAFRIDPMTGKELP